MEDKQKYSWKTQYSVVLIANLIYGLIFYFITIKFSA